MGTTLIEGQHTGEFVLSEANGTRSREAIIVTQSGAALSAGQVLGRLNDGGTATVSRKAGTVGNGVMGAVTVTNAPAGRHTLRITAAAANAGAFVVEDPEGVEIGGGNVAAPFNQGGLSFTLADGATDFAVNDMLFIDVVQGVGKYVPYNPANTNGSGKPAAILYANLPAQTGDFEAVGYVRDCEVKAYKLTGYGADAAAKLVTKTGLAKAGIIVRA